MHSPFKPVKTAYIAIKSYDFPIRYEVETCFGKGTANFRVLSAYYFSVSGHEPYAVSIAICNASLPVQLSFIYPIITRERFTGNGGQHGIVPFGKTRLHQLYL